MLNSLTVIKESGILFGTSGARGLVEQFTNNVCAAFTHSFIECMKKQFDFKSVALGIDNRPSSYAMAQACSKALEQLGIEAVYYGVVPTPALAYIAMQDKIPCIMITGSHIPFDRNGLKFYRPNGEIGKVDEEEILDTEVFFANVDNLPELIVNPRAVTEYISRYTDLFDATLLKGKRIGIYEHSSAGRDLYATLFESLGAEVLSIGRSDEFTPIDTEAVSDIDKKRAVRWTKQFRLDAIFSTDGDGDRPLVADENGEWLRGDILGLLCSVGMNIEALAIPVSCNTVIEHIDSFKHVVRTKIGSPYVIAEFSRLTSTYTSVAGFEANGGYLLGSDVVFNNRVLKALPTRDAVLPALIVLSVALDTGISQLVKSLPSRVTESDRLQNFAMGKSLKIVEYGKNSPNLLLSKLGFDYLSVARIDTTDGLRMTLDNGDIIHLRPSGNAPELRCYAESSNALTAKDYVNAVLSGVQLI